MTDEKRQDGCAEWCGLPYGDPRVPYSRPRQFLPNGLFRLTARAEGYDRPLFINMVQAFDADEARGYCRLPMPYTIKELVTWDVEEVTIRNDPPAREDAAKLLEEAVKLLELWTETYDRGHLYEESMDLLRKVRP